MSHSPQSRLYLSTGKLSYALDKGYYKVTVLVDPELHRYLRALVPRRFVCRKQKYPPHITVVRGEVPPNQSQWGLYEGRDIEFQYSDYLHSDDQYWWINCYSAKLIDIRLGLGLASSYHLTRPPDGQECFHSTIGNQKSL